MLKGMRLIELRKTTIKDTDIHHGLMAGRLIKLAPEVAVDAKEYRAAPPWTRAYFRAKAFGLSADQAALCSRSAARLLGIQVWGTDDTVELTYVGKDQGRSKSDLPPRVIYRRSLVLPDEVLTKDGVRMTGTVRTLIDLTRYHGLKEGVVAIDSALTRFPQLTKDLMRAALAALPKIKHRSRVKRAIELASAKSESPLESFARVDLHEWNHPLIHSIEAQVQFRLSDGHIVRVDLVINHWLIIELDGQVKYDGKTYGRPADEVLRAERLREKELQAQGRIVLRFQKSDLVHETPGTSVMRTQIDTMLRRFGAQGPQAA